MTKPVIEKKIKELEKRIEDLERGHTVIIQQYQPIVVQQVKHCRWCGQPEPCGQIHYIV